MGAAEAERRQGEAQVSVRLDLGGGACDVQAQNPFLAHMLEAWARHAGFGLRLRASGGLDHHLVEGTAIALGQAFRAAFAGAPCQRIAHDVAPLDDALVLAAVDLADRPYFSGELPIPLWEHFLRSLATEARITLHVAVLRGRDTHHTVEAGVTAFARALRRALQPVIEGTALPASEATPSGQQTPPRSRSASASSAPAKPLSIEEQEMLAAVERDPAEEGWAWRRGVEEHGVRKAVKDPEKGVLEVRSVAKDGRPRLEAKGRRRKPPADPGTVVAPPVPPKDGGPLPDEPQPEEANPARATPKGLAAASKEVRSGTETNELPEVKAAKQRHRETHGGEGKDA